MNIAVRFETQTLNELSSLREQYLSGLSEEQEALIEVQLADATPLLIRYEQLAIGYALVLDGTVLEYHLTEDFAVFGQTVFDQLLAATGARRAVVKSFDSLFLSSCVDRQVGIRTLGLLVRNYVRRPLPESGDLRFDARSATPDDLPAVLAIEQHVFTRPERFRYVIESGWMILFERHNELLGFGIMRPVVSARRGVDIGIALHKAHRTRGYGPYFLQHMADMCVARGLVPIAGCAVENHIVRATGERIGMYAKHRLLELRF